MKHKLYEITEQALAYYQSSLNKAENYNDLSFYFNQRPASTLSNGVGHVWVYGMLLSDATQMDRAIGATDYSDVKRDIDELLVQGAKIIMIHFNSGGGSVTGCIELAEYIEQLPVPTIAYIEGMCASAAYKLASATTHIIATKSSDVGNIGTIMVFVDTSVMSQAMGIKFIAFANEGADYKSIGHTDTLTEDQIAYLQQTINEAGQEFKDFVLRNRVITNEEVWKAAWLSGQRAIDAGLIDEIGTHDIANTRANEYISFLEAMGPYKPDKDESDYEEPDDDYEEPKDEEPIP